MSDFVNLLGEVVALDPVKVARQKKKRKEPTPSGYAWTPGTGPAGETCGSCKHLVRKRLAKTYLKCELTESKWTGGRKTDVLARSPACKHWETP